MGIRIEEISVEEYKVGVINSISHKYPKLRQKSKTVTFAAQYGGTAKTFVENSGFSLEEAKKLEKAYHELYAVSDEWTRQKLEEASRLGFVELAFGLRLRTPILQQSVFASQTGKPKETHKEEKTAGNALTQSYGLLNTRAANAFMEKVWKSQYRYDILPVAQIHDAQYYLCKATLGCLHWVNVHLIEEMRWNELPEIQHPTVKLGAELEVYHPTWADPHPIPNDLTLDQLEAHLKKLGFM